MKILDLFCGAGGAAMGYHQAAKHLCLDAQIVGVDINHQRSYPFEFVQADAIDYLIEHGHKFDLIHASPPCQFHSTATGSYKDDHVNMIPITREVIKSIGVPYIIENVAGAKRDLIDPIMLCGQMFDLKVFRHRYFECSGFRIEQPCHHKHNGSTGVGASGRRGKPGHPGKNGYVCVSGHIVNVEYCKRAMGIDWTRNRGELVQAIPPAYTKHLGYYAIMQIAGLSSC